MKKLFILFILTVNIFGQDDVAAIHSSTSDYLGGDKTALKEIYSQSLSNKNTELRPYLVKSITLLMLKSGSKKLSSYVKAINSKYSSQKLFDFLSLPPFKQECSACKGIGKTLLQCKKCTKGNCRNCKGNGFIAYGNGKSRTQRKCIACKTSGKCTHCSGTQKTPSTCRPCKTSGAVFNKNAISNGPRNALNLLLHKSAYLTKGSDFKVDQTLFKLESTEKKKAQEWLTLLTEKQSKWKVQEKNRLTAALKKAPTATQQGQTEIFVEQYEEGGSTANLDHVCLEISEFLQAQEKKSKKKFLDKVYGQFLSDTPTIHIVVNRGFTNESYDYRQRAGDGFYKFAMLRAERNGYGESAFKILNSAGAQIAGVKNGKFWIQK